MQKYLITLVLSVFTLFFTSCGKTDTGSTKPRVLVSIPPYIYFVEKIAGDLVDISTLAPEGSNPHLFEPTPKQIQEVYGSKVWIRLGENFEHKIAETLEQQHKNLIVTDLSQLLPNHTGHGHHGCSCSHHAHTHADAQDLHLWMSPVLAKEQAKSICQALQIALPEHKEILDKRLGLFLSELDTLHGKIQNQLKPFANQALIVSHPAFGYFCKDFGFTQISIETEGKEPRPQDISKVLATAKTSLVKLVLIQEQYNNNGAIAIANELDLPLCNIDPYSTKYDEMLLKISTEIVKANE
ncbi:MAG: hypothetical protein EB051_03080 [Chlamydiia bacterium]|nr:hypothetical protein [Chlamydiia bacterium]